jgi:DNA integrity scanning protein DisA with diadenylate cyclase activity
MNRKKFIGLFLIILSIFCGSEIAYANSYHAHKTLPKEQLPTQLPGERHSARKLAAQRLKVVVDLKRKERFNSVINQQQGYSGLGDGPLKNGG